jgi:hypothetical protein
MAQLEVTLLVWAMCVEVMVPVLWWLPQVIG